MDYRVLRDYYGRGHNLAIDYDRVHNFGVHFYRVHNFVVHFYRVHNLAVHDLGHSFVVDDRVYNFVKLDPRGRNLVLLERVVQHMGVYFRGDTVEVVVYGTPVHRVAVQAFAVHYYHKNPVAIEVGNNVNQVKMGAMEDVVRTPAAVVVDYLADELVVVRELCDIRYLPVVSVDNHNK